MRSRSSLCLLVLLVGSCVVHGGGGFVIGPTRTGIPAGSVSVSARISFFNIPLDGAQDVVFVLDRSGSMGGVATGFSGSSVGMGEGASLLAEIGATLANSATGNHLPSKLDVAKAELIRTLRSMPDGTRFNVIWFDDTLATPAHHMLVLDRRSRAAIERFIRNITESGTTAAVPALDLAYSMGARRIVLLSDGLANTGGDGDDLLANARDQMRRGVRFDTVGIGLDQDAALMQQLASESGGLAMMR